MKIYIIFQTIFAITFALDDTNFLKKNYISKRKTIDASKNLNPTLSDISPNIVEGTEAVPHSHPWTAALYIDDGIFCGGVLISNQWILTIASCLNKESSVVVQLGVHNRLAHESTERIFTSGNTVYIHDQAASAPLSFDIALIHLPRPVKLSDAIQSIPLPSTTDEDIGENIKLKIAGWGVTSNNATNLNDFLLEANVLTISNSDCRNTYDDSIKDSVLCTVGGYGSCYGDGGGPLTYSSEEGPVLRGLISYLPAAGCDSIYPHMFTRVKYHLQWIKKISGI